MGSRASSSRAETLPKGARVRKRRDFVAIQSRGKRLSSRHFLLVHRPSQGTEARLGITVTKKIGGAVGRNHVKRSVREGFRRARGDLPRRDVVVIARKGAAELEGVQIQEELAPLWARLGEIAP